MAAQSNCANRVFLLSGIYGFIALIPQYFMEDKLTYDLPAPFTYSDHLYGFIGVALATTLSRIVHYGICSDV
jgi:hypothetical protein